MEKQRDIYRKLILTLFKENFEQSQFLEKRDEMMNESDFVTIRDEIEVEYFTKNRGLAPYINAIKYLRTKIETCTAAKSLFGALEDFIKSKENITITKVPVYDQPEPVKKTKRKMQPSKKKQIEALQAHAECVSPHPCKKCRIVRRSEGAERKPRKQKSKTIKCAAKKSDIKTAQLSNPEYSDISDSETTANSSMNSIESMPVTTTVVKNEERPSYQLPYSDHQYSRISFYGSGMADDSSKVDEKKSIKNEPTDTQKEEASKRTAQSLLIPKQTVKQLPNLLPTVAKSLPTIPHRFKKNNGIRQPSPVCFVQHSISNTRTSTVTTVRSPAIIRPIPLPVPQPNPRVFVSAPMPMPMPISFSAPVTMFPSQGSVIQQQPVYYIRFCEPQTQAHQFYPNNLL